MKAAELKSFKERSLAKHEEIRQAIRGLEEEFISSNSPYRIGDRYKIGEKKSGKKVVDIFGYVQGIEVDYQQQSTPMLRIFIHSVQPSDRYIKTLYLHVD
jgi:hypothetical protein